jgi:hypothetical protein
VAFPVKKYLTKDVLISTSLSKDRIVALLIIFLIETLGIHVLRMGILNAEWKISYDLVEASSLEQNTQLIFHLTLRRNPYFLFLNLVVPIIFISFVNLLVFCIPVNSGERASLAFTVLLTFVVFITQMSSKRLKLYRKLFFLVSLPSSTSGSVFDFSASLLWLVNPSITLV